MNKPLETALLIENNALKAQLVQVHGAFEQRFTEQDQTYSLKLAALQLLVDKFREQLRLMRTRQFGASSEQSQYQAWLFDEAEQAVRGVGAQVAVILGRN